MQRIILTIGLPGSGKTTWAKDYCQKYLGVIRVNNDDIRVDILGKDHVWSPKDEQQVKAERQKRITQAIKDGYDVIVDNTHMNPNTLDAMVGWIHQTFPTVAIEEKDFRDVPIHVCIERDMERARKGEPAVGTKVILDMARKAGLEGAVVPNPYDPNLPWCIVSDLDGTLALFGNRRDPYNASKCDVIDEVNKPVADIIQTYWNTNVNRYSQPRVEKVFFFSGRTDKWIEPTKRFLKKPGFDVDVQNKFFELHMRHEGDRRADELVKREMYETHIKGKYNVHLIFDDRLKVIRMWKELGLPVANMGNCVDF